MNDMNPEMPRDYDYRGGSYREYDKRNYRDYGRRNYRDDYYMGNYRRGNGRRSYREEEDNYYYELEDCMHELKENARAIEDIAEMAPNQQDRNMLMKIAQKEKENSMHLKQMMEK